LCSGSIVKDGSKADAVLAYQQAVDIVNTMLATAASQAENSGLPAQGKPLSYFLPALRVSQTGFISNFRKADLVYSYNGELVQTQKELEEQTSKTVSEKKVTIGVLRKDPRKGNVWTKVEVGAKGGPLELSLEENN
jgi:PDZ domain-containing secreted protein